MKQYDKVCDDMGWNNIIVPIPPKFHPHSAKDDSFYSWITSLAVFTPESLIMQPKQMLITLITLAPPPGSPARETATQGDLQSFNHQSSSIISRVSSPIITDPVHHHWAKHIANSIPSHSSFDSRKPNCSWLGNWQLISALSKAHHGILIYQWRTAKGTWLLHLPQASEENRKYPMVFPHT